MATNSSAPQRLYLMQVAQLPGAEPNIPIVCYLVQTGDGKNILIDSGLPVMDVRQLPPGRPAPLLGQHVVEQLAQIGVQPGDIDILVCTHFDGDHAGHLGDFTQAEFVVQRSHYEQALHGDRFAMTRSQWNQPGIRYRFVEGDTELLPGLELIETSGHRTGHQSVLLRLPETGPVLLTIDAVPRKDLFTPDRPLGPMDDNNEEQVRASAGKLVTLAQRENALVIFGHDGEQWANLKKAPEYYG